MADLKQTLRNLFLLIDLKNQKLILILYIKEWVKHVTKTQEMTN